ncbi:MAG: flagellar assembly protein FliH [Spirochaetaceae bacterium]|jgi:flagellar assembly protein FliH|nr:flagellar assembly protein FliH [Spirochaetaceae bacterium]
MTKAVLRVEEVALDKNAVILAPPHAFPELAYLAAEDKKEDEKVEEEEDLGPTIEDLKQEAETFKAQWEAEKELMIRTAKSEAESIVKHAEDLAFQEVKRKTSEIQMLSRQADDEAARIVEEAQDKAQEIERSAQTAFEAEHQEAVEAGLQEGREKGYSEGKAEVERLIARMQTILERAQEKRTEILLETERQVVDLVLLITRKVVKIISESQESVIRSNVVQALRKVKNRGDVIIHVNIADIKLTTEHTKDFIAAVEGIKSIQIIEDSSVDKGGCIIETDFGEVDARISSQLAELESKILEITPITIKPKTSPSSSS